MANYTCAIRTNYFRVKDADKFKAFMSTVYSTKAEIKVFESLDKDGVTRYGFGCCGQIRGVFPTNEDGIFSEYAAFIEGLQELVAEDDAIIIFETGSDGLLYLTGTADVITTEGHKYLRIEDWATKVAAKMLHNPEFTTRVAY
jgi:hypothetical protein